MWYAFYNTYMYIHLLNIAYRPMHILCIHCVQLTFCSRSGILFAKIEALFIVESIKLKPSKSG